MAVLCSVDVLKMRSAFFQDVLAEQERAQQAEYEASRDLDHHPDSRNSTSSGSGAIWRPPVTIPEESPFEAAAFVSEL